MIAYREAVPVFLTGYELQAVMIAFYCRAESRCWPFQLLTLFPDRHRIMDLDSLVRRHALAEAETIKR